jgi:hypothetical protein
LPSCSFGVRAGIANAALGCVSANVKNKTPRIERSRDKVLWYIFHSPVRNILRFVLLDISLFRI